MPHRQIQEDHTSILQREDRELLRRCAEQHDAAAFEILADRYREALRRHITGIIRGDAAAVDDVLQEVWLRVWLRAETWDGRGAVKAWLFRVAANAALNHLRTVLRRREAPLLPSPRGPEADDEDELLPSWMIDREAPRPDDQVVRAEERRRVRRMMDALPEEKREVLRLVIEEEQGVREAADALGIPEGTVKSRLFHARKEIARSYLRDEVGDGPGGRTSRAIEGGSTSS